MCFHKYGKIENDGYQYCTKCGKAIHQCKWKFIKEISLYDTTAIFPNQIPEGYERIYECEICGEMKKEQI